MRLNPLPDYATFARLCRPGLAVPIRVEVDADTETPVSAFLKLSAGEPNAFLLESVEGGERSGRWSFLGAGPRSVYRYDLGDAGDPLAHVAAELSRNRSLTVEGTPRFAGGLVGYFGYDAVRLFEPRVPRAQDDELGFSDVLLMDFDTVVAFDNLRHAVQVVAEVRASAGDTPRALYRSALERIERTLYTMSRPLADRRPRSARAVPALRPRVSRAAFEAACRRAKAYIRAGDCQQVVLSQRFDVEVHVPPFELYRALRRVNPSPFLFYLQDGRRALVGSSPETLVRLEEGEITLRPIAGTRKRGRNAREDLAHERELLADEKEGAEHVMLVDLGRNDVGRVAEVGTVRVDVYRAIERYSHVMHIASQVRGRLRRGATALDVLRAAFPAGTVTGAPKVRAMEIIDALEPARRGPYAGAVGYFDRRGNMEMCIAIRMLLQHGRRVSIQAGAGIVHDSKPAAEYEETVSKAQALFTAVAQAESRSLQAAAPAPARRTRRGRAR